MGTSTPTVTVGALDIQPAGAATMNIPFGRMASIAEPQQLHLAVIAG